MQQYDMHDSSTHVIPGVPVNNSFASCVALTHICLTHTIYYLYAFLKVFADLESAIKEALALEQQGGQLAGGQ